MNQLHIQERNLEKGADDALTSLGTNAQLLVLVGVGGGIRSNSILPGSMSCAGGVVLSSLSTLSFGLAFLVAMPIAYKKISSLVTPVAELKKSLADLRQNVVELKNETEAVGCLQQNSFASSHITRIEALEEKHQFETTDFWAYYKRMLVWILIAAVVQWFTGSIVAADFSAKGKAPATELPNLSRAAPTEVCWTRILNLMALAFYAVRTKFMRI